MTEALFAGIEIGGTKLQIVVGNSRGEILQRKRFQVDKTSGGQGIRDVIRAELPSLLEGVARICVGFGGPVDYQSGMICCSHQIAGWNNFNFKDWFNEFTPLPVLIENDANIAALGEAIFGAGKNDNPVFYVTLGSGVGGGLVVDKQIYHGAKPGESEIGHLRLDRSGVILEERCSGWVVDRKIRELIQGNPGSPLASLAAQFPSAEAKALGAALQQQDRHAKHILLEVAQDLAFGLSHVTHLFHPQTIVIGGGLSLIGTPLIVAVEEQLKSWTMDAFAPGPRLALAQLAEDAVPIGCLVLASTVEA